VQHARKGVNPGQPRPHPARGGRYDEATSCLPGRHCHLPPDRSIRRLDRNALTVAAIAGGRGPAILTPITADCSSSWNEVLKFGDLLNEIPKLHFELRGNYHICYKVAYSSLLFEREHAGLERFS
jgi:hypothetical protein